MYSLVQQDCTYAYGGVLVNEVTSEHVRMVESLNENDER